HEGSAQTTVRSSRSRALARLGPADPRSNVHRMGARARRGGSTMNQFPVDSDSASILDRYAARNGIRLVNDGERAASRPTGKTTEDLAPEAWGALKAANNPKRLFVRGGSMVSLDVDENGVPVVRDVGPERLKLELGRAAKWIARGQRGGVLRLDPPSSIVA